MKLDWKSAEIVIELLLRKKLISKEKYYNLLSYVYEWESNCEYEIEEVNGKYEIKVVPIMSRFKKEEKHE